MLTRWPEHPQLYTYDIDHANPELSVALGSLTDESIRMLGGLSMPTSVEYAFEATADRYAPTDPEELFVRAQKVDATEPTYGFQVRMGDSRFIDEAEFTLIQPQRDGYFPWGIQVNKLTRTMMPTLRQHRLTEHSPFLQQKAVLGALALRIGEARKGRSDILASRVIRAEYPAPKY